MENGDTTYKYRVERYKFRFVFLIQFSEPFTMFGRRSFHLQTPCVTQRSHRHMAIIKARYYRAIAITALTNWSRWHFHSDYFHWHIQPKLMLGKKLGQLQNIVRSYFNIHWIGTSQRQVFIRNETHDYQSRKCLLYSAIASKVSLRRPSGI